MIEESQLEATPSTHDTTIHVAHFDCNSFEEYAEATSGWGLDWRQLDRGRFKTRLLHVATPSMLVSRFRSNRKFLQRGTSPSGVRTFGIVGVDSSPMDWGGREGNKDRIEVFPTSHAYECVSYPGFHANGLSIAEDHICSVAEVLGLPNPLETLPKGPCFVEPDPLRLQTLRRRLDGLYSAATAHAEVRLSEAARSEMELELHSALVAALATGFETPLRNPGPDFRSRTLKLALEYIEEQADLAPSITDDCRASGASYRTLNRAFLDRFGVSPKQYLQAIRLDGVRKQLQRKGPTTKIIDIANDWGFWHMGQLAADYRRQFGELPSETARRHMSSF